LLLLQFPLRVQVSIRYAYFEEDAGAADCNIPATLVVAAVCWMPLVHSVLTIPTSFKLLLSILD